MKPISHLLIIFLSCLPLAGIADLNPETSVVEIEVTKKDYLLCQRIRSTRSSPTDITFLSSLVVRRNPEDQHVIPWDVLQVRGFAMLID